MPVHMIDSLIYGGAWGTDETRAIFDDGPRTQAWLDIIVALAQAQGELGLIPPEAAEEIARVARVENLDLNEVRKGYEATGHSMLGLIRVLQRTCRGNAGEYIYYGATVQDITDTWTVLALRQVWDIVFRDLREIESTLLALAQTHRDTLMAGRTHGQPGLPITFGFKVAVWMREIRRHIERLKELRPRLAVGQLSGGVGSLSSFGEVGLELQERFLHRLGLQPPDIAWDTTRDTLAEFLNVLALIASTFDKIGQEVYNLQRPELGEVREGFVRGVVGSITMPHKRNPEIAEHLGTLARLIRHHAAALTESLVHDHERDGRSWKAEWATIPPACVMMGSALRLAKTMVTHLEVDAAAMHRNLEATRGYVLSEGVMLALAPIVGKQTAHTIVYETAMAAFEAGRPLKAALLEEPRVRAHLSAHEIETLMDYRQQVGLCPEFVDRVVALTEADQARDRAYLGGLA
ncbi:MAG: adenylosuccinate lyase family protein [Ardenticatenaceae bacterium]|nr:adenylosuccinate lyase family protein [Ardenticatenaceae bacterium]